MERDDRAASLWDGVRVGRVGRRTLLQSLLALGGGLTMTAGRAAAQTAPGRTAGGVTTPAAGASVSVRWLGGGVVEIATPDYKQIAYLDAWVWRNAGWTRFGLAKPPEYASKDGFVQYVAGKKPEAVFVLLTHDHGDHIGDYFEMLSGLVAAGVPVMTTGQGDLMRTGLVPDFRAAGLDPAKVVSNAGAAMNFGGTAKHGGMTVRLVPAVHSNLHGFPSAGFILDIGGVRLYLSGDTDLYGDMRMIGERYRPDAAVVCVGDGAFTMGPEDAAQTCRYVGASQAVPVHFAHNGLVLGPEAGESFKAALASIAPGINANVMKPGDTRLIAA